MQLKKKETNRLEYEKKILDAMDRWVDNAISKEEDDHAYVLKECVSLPQSAKFKKIDGKWKKI